MRLIFDPWALDIDRRLLTRGGQPVSLSPKAFDLLALLAGHHEKAFSKAELHAHLWPDTFVSDGSLTILIAEIRGVLEDAADQPRYVRTVRRFGYAFCAPVVASDNAKAPSSSLRSHGWVIWGDKSIALAEGETLLGRAADAQVRFEVPGVSRRHARIIISGVNVSLEDMGSQNGTYVRGDRISSRTTLRDGDEIRLGPVAIVFRLVSSDSSTLPM
jgi:DNA-binding winged helix-turn-helix (wHTH) protein